ncbi:hypothetical protein [Streptomyces sp. NPDC017940]|uniref:hypothetical protein n=1 Tax=Streptomyces sp. NPDC017940 TaxID=3365017 RepID=UPI0037937EF3
MGGLGTGTLPDNGCPHLQPAPGPPALSQPRGKGSNSLNRPSITDARWAGELGEQSSAGRFPERSQKSVIQATGFREAVDDYAEYCADIVGNAYPADTPVGIRELLDDLYAQTEQEPLPVDDAE